MKAVYATDLSEAIDATIESRTCLGCLGRYGIDEIHLITVTSPNVHAGVPGVDMSDRRERALDRQRETLAAEGFDVDVHVARGTPHRRINGLADRVAADLIVVGSRGQSPLEKRLIGSTARNVVRTAVRPVLVERIVGDEPEVAREHLFERMLYATDFSENAERAFDQFRFLGEPTEEATLLHVTGPNHDQTGDDVEDPAARLASLAEDLDRRGIDARTVVREGSPAEEILAAAGEADPTTILVGARGLSPMRRLLLGSVSERVVERAESNVLVVPPSRLR